MVGFQATVLGWRDNHLALVVKPINPSPMIAMMRFQRYALGGSANEEIHQLSYSSPAVYTLPSVSCDLAHS